MFSTRSRAWFVFAAWSLVIAAGRSAAQTCIDEDPSVSTDPMTFEYRWAGQVNRIFSLDGQEAWTAEDGGRIRHRIDDTSGWEFQHTPYEVREELRGIFFLDEDYGWCVGQSGWVLATQDGGDTWNAIARIPLSGGGYDDLQDVHFISKYDGWIAGLHGIYFTHDEGQCWEQAELYDHNGLLIDGTNPGFDVEPYSLDIVIDHPLAPTSFFGIATAEPGYVFVTQDGETWRTAFFLPTSSLCSSIVTPTSVNACNIGSEFEPWWVEISRNTTDSLTLIVGGYGNVDGVILASPDFGTTWYQELHECQLSGASCSPPSGTLGPLDSPRTLYGVSIFDGDNTAVAVGYNGQHLRRVAGAAGSTYWIDESRFANSPHPDNQYVAGTDANGSIFPLHSAWCDDGGLGAGRAYATGVGGQIRISNDGGDTWLPETDGTFHRVFDATFTDDSTGYIVGQFYRVGVTLDGGETWGPGLGLDTTKAGFAAIDSSSAGTVIAVGGVNSGATVPNIARLASSGSWTVIGSSSITLPSGYTLAPLRDVALTGSNVAWAVGDNGLVLRSTDDGATWTGFLLPDATVNLRGLAFTLPKRGVLVGRVPGTGASTARIYGVIGTSTPPSFSLLTIPSNCVTLVDAATFNNAIYACGKFDDGSGPRGILLVWNGTVFVEVSSAPTFDPCTEGVSPTTGQASILNALAFSHETGDLWIGADCGRIWQFTPSGPTWVEHKSQSSAHVQAIDFPDDVSSSEAYGYFTTFRQGEPHSVMVRYISD